MMDYVENARVTYFRNRTAKSKRENFLAFYRLGLVHGEYMQWLMDDDLIDKDKISIMMRAFLENPNVTLTSSERRLIDGTGRVIEEALNKFTDVSRVADGRKIGKITLLGIINFLGEPSTVLFRKSDLKHNYYDSACRGYQTISDVVMCLELLEKGDVAYIARPLSSFRQHDGQEQHNVNSILNSRNEWLRLICEYYSRDVFIGRADDMLSTMKLWADDYKNVLNELKNTNDKPDQAILDEYKHNAAMVNEVIAKNMRMEKLASEVKGGGTVAR
jgi:hypothetical protein